MAAWPACSEQPVQLIASLLGLSAVASQSLPESLAVISEPQTELLLGQQEPTFSWASIIESKPVIIVQKAPIHNEPCADLRERSLAQTMPASLVVQPPLSLHALKKLGPFCQYCSCKLLLDALKLEVVNFPTKVFKWAAPAQMLDMLPVLMPALLAQYPVVVLIL